MKRRLEDYFFAILKREVWRDKKSLQKDIFCRFQIASQLWDEAGQWGRKATAVDSRA
jgi:hypothetical protein